MQNIILRIESVVGYSFEFQSYHYSIGFRGILTSRLKTMSTNYTYFKLNSCYLHKPLSSRVVRPDAAPAAQLEQSAEPRAILEVRLLLPVLRVSLRSDWSSQGRRDGQAIRQGGEPSAGRKRGYQIRRDVTPSQTRLPPRLPT